MKNDENASAEYGEEAKFIDWAAEALLYLNHEDSQEVPYSGVLPENL